MGFKPKTPPSPKAVSQPKKSEGSVAALARQRERKARNQERNAPVDLSMKELRRIHRATYTERVPVEVNEEFVRQRVPKDNYVSFRVWLRRKGVHGGRKLCSVQKLSHKATAILSKE